MRRTLDHLLYRPWSLTFIIFLFQNLPPWFLIIYALFDDGYNRFNFFKIGNINSWFRRHVCVEAEILLLIWVIRIMYLSRNGRKLLLILVDLIKILFWSLQIYLLLDITHHLDVYSRRNPCGRLNLILNWRFLRSCMLSSQFLKLVLKWILLLT